MRALVVINEQHTLLPDQERVLLAEFESFERVNVPAQGWTLKDMDMAIDHMLYEQDEKVAIVFASPVPAMILRLARYNGQEEGEYGIVKQTVFVLHNDHREKKELPGGKIIMTIAAEGWQLV